MTVAVRETQNATDQDRRLTAVVERARDALLADRHPDGHRRYKLEADCTIPAGYVLFLRFLGENRPALEAKIGHFLRDQQADRGAPVRYRKKVTAG